MRQILKFSNEIYKTLGFQQYHSKKEYRLSPFLIIEKISEGLLVYNTLTYEMIFVTNMKLNDKMDYFVSRWFLIDTDIDPYSIVHTLKKIYKNTHKPKSIDKISAYTIMPTLKCNARCSYCYEADRKKYDMTEDTAIATADYILNTSNGYPTLHWFGGEPLFNVKIIDVICNKLHEKKLPFFSTIISNGYLFNEISIEKIWNWNLKNIQITLDGTKNYYNKIKNYLNEDPNPFGTVMKNIEFLLSNEITVNIRMNLCKDNISDIKSLIELLYNKFKSYKNFSAYCHPLFEENHEQIARDYVSIQKLLHNMGLSSSYSLSRLRIINNCIADSLKSVVITPNGNLGLCEHFTESELIGNIYNSEINKKVITEWQEPYEIPKCKTCPFYPQCTKIKKCPVGECHKEWREHLEFQIRDSMRNTYKKYKEGIQ